MGENTGSIKELINLTENMDCFDYLSGVESDYDLGYYWIEQSGCYDTSRLGVLSNYIDYESFGRDIRFDESGVFADHGYVRSMVVDLLTSTTARLRISPKNTVSKVQSYMNAPLSGERKRYGAIICTFDIVSAVGYSIIYHGKRK